jgi:5-methyltetrahydrofolate--homocysteine methyltransferase
MERAMRIYNGKPLVNSVNGKEESMRAVFPLVKKYGGVCIALTMDEGGIPDTAEGRVAIAERIARVAAEYGLGRQDLVFDPLAMAVSSDPNAARATLDAVAELTERGYYTSLGVSNVSFGMPCREKLNATFFAMALSAGLSAAIMNPHSEDMMAAYRAYLALTGKDAGFADYIAFADGRGAQAQKEAPKAELTPAAAIVSGLCDDAVRLTRAALESREPMEVINSEIIPALSAVGADFESGRVYLPGLLMSAEAARAALDVAKEKMPAKESAGDAPIVIATVKGDIHDIGKNIVRAVLESHGFSVIDLGRDVSAERILDAAEKNGAALVGLSALMTTTVPAMAEAVKLLAERLPGCPVMVGGAVLNEEYAEMIGAHYYAKDAMGAVRIAKQVLGK